MAKYTTSTDSTRSFPSQWTRSKSTLKSICTPILNLLLLFQLATCSPQKPDLNVVRVNKCCEKFEIIVDSHCSHVNQSGLPHVGVWDPVFTGYNGQDNVQVGDFKFVIGSPDCGPLQLWPIFHYPNSADKLVLLPDGKLRHYIKDPESLDDTFHVKHMNEEDHEDEEKPLYYDYQQGHYCMDKSINTKDEGSQAHFAMVCNPERANNYWTTDAIIRKIVSPVCHAISMISLLIIAIVYFVLPTLRDLVGNIVTTITVCLIIAQAADLIRIFTEFSSHISFLVADAILYTFTMAAFLWLNSMGYYIWSTFKSRNVFLRVTDGRKYCWYSGYAWSVTGVMTGVAIFAHHYLDTSASKQHSIIEDQETIGKLGIGIFFTPIAFVIVINTFFYVTTAKIINRMNTYGRIHHKLRANFMMFSFMFLIMGVSWLFLVLSWTKYDGLVYAHILVSALQAPLLLYICVLRQKHVMFLLKKSCCYNEPPSAADWGDEMTYMNTADY